MDATFGDYLASEGDCWYVNLMTFLGDSSIDVLGVLEKFRAEFTTTAGLAFLQLYWLRWRFSIPTLECCVLLVTS